MTLLINVEEARRVLTMDHCLEVLEIAYRDLSNKEAVVAPHGGRWDVWMPQKSDNRYYVFGSLQGGSRSLGVFALRFKTDVWTFPGEGEEQTLDKYCVEPGKYCGLVLLFSTENAEPLAILNDGYLQHMRVGATAGLGAKFMAREDVSTVGVLGSGGMARTYLEAFCRVRNIKRAKVYSPTKAHREEYAAEMSDRLGIDVIPASSAAEAMSDVDMLAGCTDAAQPVFDPEWLRPGVHISPVLPREMPRTAVAKCDVIVRHLNGGAEGFFAGEEEEYGAVPNGFFEDTYHGVDRMEVPTLADLVSGKTPGRVSPDQVTCFYNVPGSGLQFAAVAGAVYKLAKEAGLGREIPTDWLLQDVRD